MINVEMECGWIVAREGDGAHYVWLLKAEVHELNGK